MKKPLTVQERQEVLINVLLENAPNFAVFGVGKDVVNPLIKKGWIHADTYKHTGGATLTKQGRAQNVSTSHTYMK